MLLMVCCAANASAASITGRISTSGSPEHRQTLIATDPTKSPISICDGGRKFELTQLAGSVLTLSGDFKTKIKEKPECFFVTDFTVDEITPGRPAIVGTLVKTDKDKYAVINSSGKKWILSGLAPGLKDLINLSVICDLVADDASTGETTWIVATAFAMPTQ